MGKYNTILHYLPAVVSAAVISFIFSMGDYLGMNSIDPSFIDEISGTNMDGSRKILVSYLFTTPEIWIKNPIAILLVVLIVMLSLGLLVIGAGIKGMLSALFGYVGVLLVLLESNSTGFILLILGALISSLSNDKDYDSLRN